MRIRTGVSAAAIAAALLFSAGGARAEGPAPAVAQVSILGVDRFFSAPAVLGDSWSRAVNAALGEVARLLDLDRVTLRQAAYAPALPRRRTVAWQAQAPSTSVQDLEPVRALIELRPVLIEPPTQATGDVRGERAALLGAHLELPWSVP